MDFNNRFYIRPIHEQYLFYRKCNEHDEECYYKVSNQSRASVPIFKQLKKLNQNLQLQAKLTIKKTIQKKLSNV